MKNVDTPPVQAVARAMRLLKLTASGHEDGKSAQALTAASGLNRTTVIRLLACLAHTGYVQRCDETGTYRPGLKAMQLGLSAMNRAPIVKRLRPVMQSIARITGDTVFLIVRNGDYAHCLHLERGAFPVQAIMSLIGSFRLMGEGTAGQALLATLSDTELLELYHRHAAEYARKGLSSDQLSRMVQRTRMERYATGIGMIAKEANAVGIPFEITPGHYAALSVGAIASRLDAARRMEVAQIMKDVLRQAGVSPFF
jgi:DNA-binding IclR family transcriptional regulator